MNLTNYHSHCSFCDGQAPAEEFVKSAISAGFTAYGVSSHAPLPFTTSWSLTKERVPDYLDELNRLKKRYADQIELYIGMEIDYLKGVQKPSDDYFQQLPLDYRIGSVHLLTADDGEIVDVDTNIEKFEKVLKLHFQGDLRRVIEQYYKASCELVEIGGFDFLGHADKISFNSEYLQPGITLQDWYQTLRKEFFQLVAEKGVKLEINTKSFLRRGCFFPDQRYFAEIRHLNIPVLVNSDAHFPDLITVGRREALALLLEHGFRSVYELHGGKWQEVPIDITE